MTHFLRRAWRYLERLHATRPPSTSRAPGPLRQVAALVANRVTGMLGVPVRAAYTAGVGVAKMRERMRWGRANFTARVGAPVAMPVLRHAALWQAGIVAQGGAAPVAHVNLRVQDPDCVQIDRLLSVFLLSEKLGSISFFFDDAAALAARHTSQTLAEESNAASAFDLGTAPIAADSAAVDWSMIFSGRNGFGGAANHYLKVACPGAYVVALSLSETDDAFCEPSAFREWLATIRDFRPPIQPLCFVLLNAVLPDAAQADQTSGRLRMPRTVGLSLTEAIRLAQQADAYVGPMDIFGMAALGMRRPGVYLRADLRDSPELSNCMLTGDLNAPEALEALQSILVRLSSSTPRIETSPTPSLNTFLAR